MHGKSTLVDLHLGSDATLRQALEQIDSNNKGIVLVVDDDRRLVDTITDGDVRRAILSGLSIDQPVCDLLAVKTWALKRRPVTAPVDTKREQLIQLMQEQQVRQVPLLDKDARVVDLVTLHELLPEILPPVQAVIMAGGFGTRLRPHTEVIPKPMLPVGDRPLMERIVRQLHGAGIRRVNISTHYLADKIVAHFGDGRNFGVDVNYLREDQPLGTAGALGLMAPPRERCLVINGDILTRVDFRALLAYHVEQDACMTIGVRSYEFKVPYGVIETDGPRVLKVEEKPSLSFFVNAGIYVLEPQVHALIPRGRRFDMTDLIAVLLQQGRLVVSFPILEYWLDIGRQPDYDQAQQDVRPGGRQAA
jgi:dTDP-glucose pyrophosphorylase